jgi:hypothetical protein
VKQDAVEDPAEPDPEEDACGADGWPASGGGLGYRGSTDVGSRLDRGRLSISALYGRAMGVACRRQLEWATAGRADGSFSGLRVGDW